MAIWLLALVIVHVSSHPRKQPLTKEDAAAARYGKSPVRHRQYHPTQHEKGAAGDRMAADEKFQEFKFGNRKFLFTDAHHGTGENWNNSRQICKDKGGDLAIMKNWHLVHAIKPALHSSYAWQFWVGARREGYGKDWYWVNGEKISESWLKNTNVGNGVYDDNCLVWNSSWEKYEDDACAGRTGNKFICEIP